MERIESTDEGKTFLSSFYSEDEYTIFAPTDQAFKGYGLDSSNIREENAYWLQDVIKYHVSVDHSPQKSALQLVLDWTAMLIGHQGKDQDLSDRPSPLPYDPLDALSQLHQPTSRCRPGSDLRCAAR